MGSMSYLSVIESYHDNKAVVHDLVSSILTGISVPDLFLQVGAEADVLRDISVHYPFVELLYTLDDKGVQISENYTYTKEGVGVLPGAKNTNRSQRPYFKLANSEKDIDITSPYMSSATGHLCLSAAIKYTCLLYTSPSPRDS